MATYYVRKTGSDAAAGTSAGAAFLTIGKALSVVAAGEIIYVGAGTYRETVATLTTAGGAGSVISVIGDVDGSHTGDSGDVIWTAYTTDDKTNPAASALVGCNGKGHYAWTNLILVGGNTLQSIFDANTATNAVDYTFTRCTFLPGASSRNLTAYKGIANTAGAWTFDSCVFMVPDGGSAISLTLPTSGTADWDAQIVFKNCLAIMGGGGFLVSGGTSGALANKPGGLIVDNCTVIGGSSVMTVTTNFSTSTPSRVRNSFLLGQSGNCLSSAVNGQIVEDYNVFACATPRGGAGAPSTGANSKGSTTYTYAPMIEIGQAALNGRRVRFHGTPSAGSPLLGFGTDGAVAFTTDLLGTPRPAGGTSASKAIGALERRDTWVRDATTFDTTPASWRSDGPGVQYFELDVDAAAHTVKFKIRYDGTYTGTKPTVKIIDGAECGVADVTGSFGAGGSDADPGANAWAFIQVAFTPTSAGRVTVALISSDTNGAGKAWADSGAVT